MSFKSSRESQSTCCGDPVQPPDRRETFFLVVVTAEIVAVMGLTCWTIDSITFPLTDDTRYSFAYAITMLFNALCILYFVFDGILRERREELVAFFVASLLVAAYSCYDYFIACRNDDMCLARMVVALALQPFNVGFGALLMSDLNWLAYKVGGANAELQRLYRQHGAFLGVTKVDFQVAVSLVILASFSGVLSETALFLSVIGLWVSAWWLVGAWFASRHEHRAVMVVFFVFALLQPAYVLYKLVSIATDWSEYQQLISYPCLVLGGLSLALRAVVVALGARVYRDFGRGLQAHLLNQPQAAALLPK